MSIGTIVGLRQSTSLHRWTKASFEMYVEIVILCDLAPPTVSEVNTTVVNTNHISVIVIIMWDFIQELTTNKTHHINNNVISLSEHVCKAVTQGKSSWIRQNTVDSTSISSWLTTCSSPYTSWTCAILHTSPVRQGFEGMSLTEDVLVLSSGQRRGFIFSSSQQYYHKMLLTTLC